MLYAPHIPGGDVGCVRIAQKLRRLVDRTDGWQLAISARRSDISGNKLAWPIARFHGLAERAKGGEKDKAYQNADVRDIAHLTESGSAPFDVLFLPYAWCTIPLGCTVPIPAPIVAAIPNLEFDFLDYGLTTDQFRRDLDKLMRLDARFVFPSETTRRRAIDDFGVASDRTYVVAPTATYAGENIDVLKVRAKYRLPERFVLCEDWLKPQRNGRAIIQAMAGLKGEWPLVCIGAGIDEFLGTSFSKEPYAKECHLAAEANGMLADRDVLDLGSVSRDDMLALVAGAGAVVVPSVADGATPSLILDALSLGTPVVYSRIEAYVELLGDMDDVAVGCDPNDSNDIRRAIQWALESSEARSRRSEAGRTLVAGRTEMDAARQLLEICGQVATQSQSAPKPVAIKPVVGRDQRVAWLINHTTLRDFEVPLMRSLGYEVYTSKLLPKGNDIISITVDYSEDENTTLPTWVLNYLNKQNLYEDAINPGLAEILNSYFGTVICTAVGPMVKELVQHYRGRILIRVFGREHPRCYSEYLNHFGGGKLWENIWKIQNRFWFAQCYESIGNIEQKLIKDRVLTLPLGLPDRILRHRGNWTGNDKRILFVCSRIKASPTYYGKIYEEFKLHFGDLPHLIAGTQPMPVADECVSGFAPDHTFRHWLREFRVMFYHSREPRHLHYHPLEAVVHGMPLIYMKGGLLEQYGGADQPGACDTLEEARKKVIRILEDDVEFIRRVQERQHVMLEEFLWNYNRQVWQEKFSGVALATPLAPNIPTINQWREPPTSLVGSSIRLSTIPAGVKPRILHYGAPRDAFDFIGTLVRRLAHRPTPEMSYKVVLGGGATPELMELDTSIAEVDILPEHATPKLIHSLATDQPLKLQWNSVASIVDWLSQTAPFRRSRIIRFGMKLGICGLLYARGVVRQKTLIPRRTGIASYFPRVFLRIPGVHQVFEWNAWRTSLAIASGRESHAADGVFSPFLVNPPAAEIQKLPEGNEVPPMDFDVLDAFMQTGVTVIPRPVGVLPPNLPIESCKPRAVVVCINDLDFEFSERFGNLNLAAAREMVLWGRIAERFVFGSTSVRNEAVRRYGIPAEKTRLITWPAMALADERNRVSRRRSLPAQYILSFDGDAGDSSGLELIQAVHVLRWRQESTLPVVFVRRRYGGDESAAFYAFKLEFERAMAVLKWTRGDDYHIVEIDGDSELPILFKNATVCVSTSRSPANLERIALDAFTYRTPMVATAMQDTAKRFGDHQRLLTLVDSDDAVAIADAIGRVLSNPAAAQAQVEQAADFVRRESWEAAAQEFTAIVAEAAATYAETVSEGDAIDEIAPECLPVSRAA